MYFPPPTYMSNFANTMQRFNQLQDQAGALAKMMPTVTTAPPPTPGALPAAPAPFVTPKHAYNLVGAPGVPQLGTGPLNNIDTSAALAQFRATNPNQVHQLRQTAPGVFAAPPPVRNLISPGSPMATMGKQIAAGRQNTYRKLYG